MVPTPRDLASLPRVERFLLDRAEGHPRDLARVAVEEFRITRQAVNRHLRRLVERGFLQRTGLTRSVEYHLRSLGHLTKQIPITSELEEDVVWTREVLPLVRDAAENVRDICAYGFTEILNNAKDHSGSDEALIKADVTAAKVTLKVMDRGIGIFRKIKEECALEDERQAVLELTKGKLTTDPDRHTGEGIFFTSRVFDHFSILSGRLYLGCQRGGTDWLLEDADEVPGTSVAMEIYPFAKQTLREVFERYATEQDDYAFRRTHVVVRLAGGQGETLISRSQAKRMLARLDRFKEIVLDFKGVESIGPAFTDELFRVFPAHHPETKLVPINANDEVMKMIRRSLPGTDTSGPYTSSREPAPPGGT